MNLTEWLLALLVSVGLSAAGGVAWGTKQGKAVTAAAQDRQTVKDLTGLVEQHAELVKQSKAASRDMRRALAARTVVDERSTREIRDALATTAASRAGCVFPPDVMRHLATARDRAATAAASGIRGALPGPAASAAGQR